jgi:HAD superfamily hydrolase (TIGR01509 family)
MEAIIARALEVALIDVGGTLWPNSWPIRASDAEGRRNRIRAAMQGLDPTTVEALADALIESSRPGDEARSITTESPVAVGAEALIARCLQRCALPADAETIRKLRRAMSIPVSDQMKLLPGAAELLTEIRRLGLRTIVASNTYWRDADSYWDDFRTLGVADRIDAIVTSVDAGHLKPHPAVFEMARRLADVPAERCVVIGNKEANDVEPALALGMKAILVHPDDPKPASSKAHAVAADLWECTRVLRDMLETE